MKLIELLPFLKSNQYYMFVWSDEILCFTGIRLLSDSYIQATIKSLLDYSVVRINCRKRVMFNKQRNYLEVNLLKLCETI